MTYNKGYGLLILRIFVGLLFIIPGIGKLMNPSGIIGMLTNLGYPIPGLLGWILLLSEIVFGLSLIVGWKVRYTVWPLFIALALATLTVVIPNMNGNPVNLLFHLTGLAALLAIFLEGAGPMKIGK